MLAPRVNAAGRMSTPDIAARLLLATDEAMGEEARALAQQLCDENTRRQQEEAELVTHAKKAIETDPAVGAHNVLVIGGVGWHRGVIGIAASKLVDTYHKPAIVLSIDGDVAHGSCRSIPDFDLLAALEQCSDLFMKFGGHKQAAGADDGSGARAGVPRADQRLRRPGDRARPASAAAADRRAVVAPWASRTIWSAASTCSGPSAWRTRGRCFTRRGVEIVDGPRTIKERHLKMTFAQDGRRFRAIAWRAAERADFLEKNRAAMNLAFSLDRNEYQGETYLELSVADFKAMDDQ